MLVKTLDNFRAALDKQLLLAANYLNFLTTCKSQTIKPQPKVTEFRGSFVTLKITIGYARNDDQKQLARLKQRSGTQTVNIDFSFNEWIVDPIELSINGTDIPAYCKENMVAEKFRAILQQIEKNKYRSNDVFDLARLVSKPMDQGKVVQILKETCKRRKVNVSPDSFKNPEYRKAASKGYEQIGIQIGDETLPNFDASWASIRAFFEKLPWEQGD
ncbi:MAG: hypothetical protein A2600_09765 [Candidatus Lambdaproteobacteria bacterium RIFOXYD1_FULL_56_27]|uniref:Nucleotidyl transferase AbiEii/AbiGii toxin family protein n=1 Tax=Candidatus Lambdaproteobacteria bacterium RIFOXYD2_FULL_56_26 TaxID=1817773 RepID=A0A1F6GV76_9PROT|nr:MAG: hypothetical protein A2557_05035 [Candidatus Lambdaproteobacteria bacterium RIFOXYD2_FULL_56_26]OGH02327.1 MAG: hypothetical protein A2426_03515 [Candidatus Lambdaproteobacteria bacterium RIFOXYC1_FULL_56_13]OGH10097.1 MAG: hypothetical protein A2600_09765 [Candidatus Lambdaproteobacteria bacterium RIFOXYD1_FULL_56_27]